MLCLPTPSGIRIEWAKSRIQAHHWRTQLLLLCEEMRRSLKYVKHTATMWRDLTNNSEHSSLAEGRNAYAVKHAVAYEGLYQKWAAKWQPLVTAAKRTPFQADIVGLGLDTPVAEGPVEVDVDDDNDDNDAAADALDELVRALPLSNVL